MCIKFRTVYSLFFSAHWFALRGSHRRINRSLTHLLITQIMRIENIQVGAILSYALLNYYILFSLSTFIRFGFCTFFVYFIFLLLLACFCSEHLICVSGWWRKEINCVVAIIICNSVVNSCIPMCLHTKSWFSIRTHQYEWNDEAHLHKMRFTECAISALKSIGFCQSINKMVHA